MLNGPGTHKLSDHPSEATALDADNPLTSAVAQRAGLTGPAHVTCAFDGGGGGI
jgi:hypothetical protein